MTKKHFERFAIAAADIIGNLNLQGYEMLPVIKFISLACSEFNSRFEPDRFDRRVREILIHRGSMGVHRGAAE